MPDTLAAQSQTSRSLTSGTVLSMSNGLHVPRGDRWTEYEHDQIFAEEEEEELKG